MRLLRLLVLPLLFSLSALVHADVQANEDWSLARDRDGIKVWTRLLPDFPIREFKAVVTVKSTLSGLVNLILDTDHADRWVYRTDRITVLKRDDAKGTFLIRVETDFPWPLSDRDAVLEGQIVQDEKTGVVTVRSHAQASGLYPLNPDFVRMADMDGTWIFRPLGQGMVEVTMIGRADPAGHIPASAVNLIIHETPYRTLQGLRKVIGDVRYQKTPMPQIRDMP
jgi:hypothetical protein